MHDHEPIHITVPGHPGDPRDPLPDPPPGIEIHYAPDLHPDDIETVDGIPVTSVSRTLIDLGEVLSEEELRECFAVARGRGMLDAEQLAACRSRVEWRPSLEMVDRLIAEFT